MFDGLSPALIWRLVAAAQDPDSGVNAVEIKHWGEPSGTRPTWSPALSATANYRCS